MDGTHKYAVQRCGNFENTLYNKDCLKKAVINAIKKTSEAYDQLKQRSETIESTFALFLEKHKGFSNTFKKNEEKMRNGISTQNNADTVEGALAIVDTIQAIKISEKTDINTMNKILYDMIVLLDRCTIFQEQCLICVRKGISLSASINPYNQNVLFSSATFTEDGKIKPADLEPLDLDFNYDNKFSTFDVPIVLNNLEKKDNDTEDTAVMHPKTSPPSGPPKQRRRRGPLSVISVALQPKKEKKVFKSFLNISKGNRIVDLRTQIQNNGFKGLSLDEKKFLRHVYNSSLTHSNNSIETIMTELGKMRQQVPPALQLIKETIAILRNVRNGIETELKINVN